ncbi:hypothetical protein ACC732_36980, partial [Rhizobium ruizarguesonis]
REGERGRKEKGEKREREKEERGGKKEKKKEREKRGEEEKREKVKMAGGKASENSRGVRHRRGLPKAFVSESGAEIYGVGG